VHAGQLLVQFGVPWQTLENCAIELVYPTKLAACSDAAVEDDEQHPWREGFRPVLKGRVAYCLCESCDKTY
jgi:hypothetical protein